MADSGRNESCKLPAIRRPSRTGGEALTEHQSDTNQSINAINQLMHQSFSRADEYDGRRHPVNLMLTAACLQPKYAY